MNIDLKLYQEIEKILGEKQEQLAAEIVSGKAASFDDYRYRVGKLRGYSDALIAAREAQARVLGIERND
jgi:5-formyltetrahydrofolate cyclo-ligase